jgi:hypothetical protein
MHTLIAQIAHILAAAAPTLNSVNIKANQIGVPTSTGDIATGIANVIKLMMTVVGMLSLVFLIVGGLRYVISTGDSKRVSQARETILYAVVGIIVSIAAYAIVSFVAKSFK